MTDDNARYVLIEPPGPIDAGFTISWLQAAIHADRILQYYFEHNPDFRKSIERLEVAHCIEFAPPAMAFLRAWLTDLGPFTLNVFDQWGEIFAIMVELGFFSLTGQRHQMTVPYLNISYITKALERLAATEDAEYFLHPENLLTTMTYQEAVEMQSTLKAMIGLTGSLRGTPYWQVQLRSCLAAAANCRSTIRLS